MSLTPEDRDLIGRLSRQIRANQRQLDLLDSYFDGQQKLAHIGLAVPPELRDFEVVVNVPRMAVTEPERRQELKGFQRTGAATIDGGLQEVWDSNNLGSQSSLAHTDAKVYGRSYVSVSADPEGGGIPLIQVESPKAMALEIDPRGRTLAALREYRDATARTRYATLYLPDSTLWLEWEAGAGYQVTDIDEHRLGRVPVVGILNQPRSGDFLGRSEMTDVMGMTDSIARIISNMAVGSEALALPHRWAAGVAKSDFLDAKTGKPLAAWEAYMTALRATENPDAKFGSFQAADLANFHKAVDAMLSWCSAVLGLPVRFMGQQTANPASEGAINADEARLIRNVERMNVHAGDSWSWAMDIVERFITGEWPARNSIRTLWQDPATPTRAQLADAAGKLKAQGVLSREGVWDEMGWDEPRKQREKAYFAAELDDPVMARLDQLVSGSAA